ncbi:hypothetical protein DRO64_06620, partial [Candidatus Bathyarchaeota archaeon]
GYILKYKIFLHPKTAEFLENLNSSLKVMIKKRLRELEESPKRRVNTLGIPHSTESNIRD